MISPEIKSHADLQRDVTEVLKSQDFYVTSSAYHDVMEDEEKRRLSQMKNPTALGVRTRSDLIAFHKSLDLSFKLEFKTHSGGGNTPHNMAIEALPLVHHWVERDLGVDCLYVYRDAFIEVEGAFWIGDKLPVERLIIPKKWESLTDYLTPYFPGVQISKPDRTFGSGDPFVVIKQAKLGSLLTEWRTEVGDAVAIAQYESAQPPVAS